MCDGSVPQAKQAQQGALCELTQLASDGAGEPKSQAHGSPGVETGCAIAQKDRAVWQRSIP